MSKRTKRFIHTLAVFITVNCFTGFSLQARTANDLERDVTSKPDKVIQFSGVKVGDKVLDFLAGGGYYSELLSPIVGTSGEVILQNNQAYIPYVGKELEARLADNRLANVTRLMSEVDDLQLGSEQFDLVYFVLGYHDLYVTDKNWNMPAHKVIPQIVRSLKPTGKLLIIDHSAKSASGINSAQKLHRIEADFVKSDLLQYGLTLVKSTEILSNGEDNLEISVFDPSIRRRTDRFVLLFEKSVNDRFLNN